MGPVLKTLLGLFLFVWTVVGIVTLAGGVLAASQFSKVANELSSILSSFSGVTDLTTGGSAINQVTNQANQMPPPGLTPEMQACLDKELGANAIAKFGQGDQPSEKNLAVFETCGFVPPMDPVSSGDSPSGTQPTKAF